MTQLIAKTAVFYGTRTRRKGETFEAERKYADVLVLAGKAEYVEQEPQKELGATKPRRRYRRRDMQAEG